MTVNRAATLTSKQIDGVVRHINQTSETPERDELMFLLSHLAGMRVGEITKLNIDTAFLDAEGRVPLRSDLRLIRVLSNTSKGERYREVPMHQRIAESLKRFIKRHPHINYIAFSTRNGGNRLAVDTVTWWFWKLYREAGLHNCSSHSGRRSFATRSARMLNNYGQSLKDLQVLLGHTRLETTQAYIEPTSQTHNLIGAL